MNLKWSLGQNDVMPRTHITVNVLNVSKAAWQKVSGQVLAK